METPTDYTLVRYGRSTLLCRSIVGTVTMQAVARFDDEGEAKRALGACIKTQEQRRRDSGEGSTRRTRVA